MPDTIRMASMELVSTNENPQIVHPYCKVCGWRKGGRDSWDGFACKCGHSEPAIRRVDVARQVSCVFEAYGGPRCTDRCMEPRDCNGLPPSRTAP